MKSSDCVVCHGEQTVDNLVYLQHGGSSLSLPVCRGHWGEVELAYQKSLRHVVTTADLREPPGPCPVCSGEQTIEGRTWLEYRDTPGLTPVCRHHHGQLEECRVETARVRTPPINVRCAGLKVGAAPREPY